VREESAEELLEVGRVVRPHGLSGEQVVELLTNRPERLEPGTILYADDRELRVQRSRPFKQRWLVVFEGVGDIDAAEQMRDTKLFAPPISDPGTLWVHELVGASVRSVSGEDLGRVTSVLANPASDLLELDRGGLIPARFVVEHGPGTVVVDVPPGLLD